MIPSDSARIVMMPSAPGSMASQRITRPSAWLLPVFMTSVSGLAPTSVTPRELLLVAATEPESVYRELRVL